ncbi:hypothetical protein AMECASPLE_024308 [Ameca splendens]|uniref:Uncharacterized protein n=1 Tax=Ameca splendens TaxID=208324 RepID=A0ABV0XTE8_9TELE
MNCKRGEERNTCSALDVALDSILVGWLLVERLTTVPSFHHLCVMDLCVLDLTFLIKGQCTLGAPRGGLSLDTCQKNTHWKCQSRSVDFCQMRLSIYASRCCSLPRGNKGVT